MKTKKYPSPLTRQWHEDIWLLGSGKKELAKLKPFTKQHILLEKRIARAATRLHEKQFGPPLPKVPPPEKEGPCRCQDFESYEEWLIRIGKYDEYNETFYSMCPFRTFDWVILCAVCVEFGRQLGGGTL